MQYEVRRLLDRYRARELADGAEVTAESSRAYATGVRTQSVWLSAYPIFPAEAGVTPSTLYPTICA
jgi:hypothetical protein